MRAKEYIEINKDSIQYLNEIIRIVNDLLPIRNDENKTNEYHKNILTADWRYKLYKDDLYNFDMNTKNGVIIDKPVFNFHDGEIPEDIALNFRKQLFEVVKEDKSFGYIFYLLASERNRTEDDPLWKGNPIKCIPNSVEIKKAITYYKDDYPKEELENYLTDLSNYDFYKQNKSNKYTSGQWLHVFNTAHYLFDEIRIRMHKPFQAFEFVKEYEFEDEQKKLDIIALIINLSKVCQSYSTEEQVIQIKIVVDELTELLNPYGASKETIQTNDPADESSLQDTEDNTSRTMKVTTNVMVELLKQLNINQSTADKTKIAEFISYITGFSVNRIRAQLTNTEELTRIHRNEVEKINKILSSINSSISIKYNNNR